MPGPRRTCAALGFSLRALAFRLPRKYNEKSGRHEHPPNLRNWAMRRHWSVAAVTLALAVARPAVALEPRDVFVVYNRDVKDSEAVAEHYRAKRGVPAANLI